MIWVILNESWFSSGRDVVAQQWLPDKWDIPSAEWRIRNRSPDASRVEKQYLFHFRDRLRILHQTRLKTMKVLMKEYSLKVFSIQKMLKVGEDEQQKVEATLIGMVHHFEKSKNGDLRIFWIFHKTYILISEWRISRFSWRMVILRILRVLRRFQNFDNFFFLICHMIFIIFMTFIMIVGVILFFRFSRCCCIVKVRSKHTILSWFWWSWW